MNDISYPYDWDDRPKAMWVEGVLADLEPDPAPEADPWINGRYAFAALAWGLIVLLVLTVRVQA